jgi:hypothetical protein
MAPTQAARTAATRTPRRRALAAALTGGAAAAAMVALGGAALASPAPAHTHAAAAPAALTAQTAKTTTVPVNCTAAPSKCGYPGSSNTGVPAGTALKAVPGQVSSGPGWHYDSRGWVEVTGSGATLTGLNIPYNVDVQASNVTLNDDNITTAGTFGVSLRHTAGATIENSTINGTNTGAGRVDAAVSDVYGDSTATVVKNDNISDFRIGVQLPAGTISGNYLHNVGYINGDHTDGIMAGGSTTPATITGNTVFISLGQTDAITIDASSSGQEVANQTITGNFLAGGAYALYAGAGNNDKTANIHITGNRFGQQYFAKSGQYGPDAYYNSTDPGNVWSGNVWDTTGQPAT